MYESPNMMWFLRSCYPKRRRLTGFMLLGSITLMVIFLASFLINNDLPTAEKMHQTIVKLEARIQFLESVYRVPHDDITKFQGVGKNGNNPAEIKPDYPKMQLMSPRVMAMLKNLTGMRAASGIRTTTPVIMETSFVYKLLPHLMDDPDSLRPSYHLKRDRKYAEIVIGIPTVKRDKESYLLVTLTHLVNGLTRNDLKDTLIIVFVGETDLVFVLETAKQIESMFPKQIESGLIEILAPSASYYPDLEKLPQTLGDSQKRVKWRSKQNLDTIYLMSYAQSQGIYYLMLEDDVIAKNKYIEEIKEFTVTTSVSTPNWYILEFCHIGGIGKLFKSAHINDFVVYVQLFYNNMPIDWLIESYLADRVCTIDKSTDPKYGSLPTFYPHSNPPIKFIRSSIREQSNHTLKNAYNGKDFFWGEKPKKGDIIEFWFSKPTIVTSFTFRSGNVKHVSDKFYDTAIEIYPARSRNYTIVAYFDEFGLADGTLKQNIGPLLAIRLRVNRYSFYQVILSEIDIQTGNNEDIVSPKSTFNKKKKRIKHDYLRLKKNTKNSKPF